MLGRIGLALLAITLASCGGDGEKPPIPPASTITIPDPVSYMAQSRAHNGDVTTPLHDYDPITYRRFDYGHVQASDSFLTGPASAITTWSYAPWREFNAANGDGGENYELQGNAIRVLSTQDGGAPGVRPLVPQWTVLTTDTIDCTKGWTTYSALERGCRATINYPGIGPVDTVVSEHRWIFMERIFLGRGWGRLAWQTFRSDSTPPVNPARCIDFGWNADVRGETLTDCRYAVNIEPVDGVLTGAMLWHP
jgi:hypothetical protein